MKTFFEKNGISSLILNYGREYLPLPDIMYIVGESNYSYIITKTNRPKLSSFTLKNFSSKLLTFPNFISPRKGLLINLDFLSTVIQQNNKLYAVMSDGKEHLLSRRKGKCLLCYLTENQPGKIIGNR